MKESAFASRRLMHALAGVCFVHVDSKIKSITLPINLSQNMFCSLSMKSITNDMPKPVIKA